MIYLIIFLSVILIEQISIPCRDVFEGASEVQLKGVITQIDEVGGPRKKRLVANFTDGTGSIDLVWFKGIKWVKKSLVQKQGNDCFWSAKSASGKGLI